jgi:rSAM/selenodomain-associated transferase 1
MTQNALIIFVKTPVVGYVKTRFQPQIPPKDAVKIYQSFILDLHQRFGRHPAFDCWYAVAPENFDRQTFDRLLGPVKLFLQERGGLGKRMSCAIEILLETGYKHVALIGSDIPQLPLYFVLESFNQLTFHDIVLGPSDDGGYYLIALNIIRPELFSNMTWSTDQVFLKTLESAGQHQLKSYLLKQLTDIDDYHSLKTLYSQLKQADQSSPDFPKATWQLIQEIFEISLRGKYL